MNYKKIHSLFTQNNQFLITMHVNPDPDAIGSAVGLALYLKGLGKKVTVVNEDGCPDRLSFMPKSKSIKKTDDCKKINYDVAIVLDSGDFGRIGNVDRLIDEAKPIINIDHHVTNTKFGTHPLVLVKSSSTAEIVYDLIKANKGVISKDIAVLLYMGIMTDTGSFRFDATTAHTHEVAAELMKFPFSPDKLYQQMYEVTPVKDLKPLLGLMSTVDLQCQHRVAFVSVSLKNQQQLSGDFDLRDRIFRFLRSMAGIDVIVIFTEQEDGSVRLNFRSQSKFDVSALASAFGGGGHTKASGGQFPNGLDAAKKAVLKEIKKKIKI